MVRSLLGDALRTEATRRVGTGARFIQRLPTGYARYRKLTSPVDNPWINRFVPTPNRREQETNHEPLN